MGARRGGERRQIVLQCSAATSSSSSSRRGSRAVCLTSASFRLMDYTISLQVQNQLAVFPTHVCQSYSVELQSRKHANKVRLYYMLHPVDGGCPAKKLRTDNGSDESDVDKNKCCTLCNMSFTSAVVAQSHYQGKIHAKRLKLLLGEQPAITAKGKLHLKRNLKHCLCSQSDLFCRKKLLWNKR
uniref:Zinc finger, matrin-type 4a n=1 Tax=Oryzias latipes TaxID=8090 RepID=A0A3B3HR50_ORYLA